MIKRSFCVHVCWVSLLGMYICHVIAISGLSLPSLIHEFVRELVHLRNQVEEKEIFLYHSCCCLIEMTWCFIFLVQLKVDVIYI